MDYSFTAYTADRILKKGKISASSEEAAAKLLSYGGYQVLSLKLIVPFFDKEKLAQWTYRIKVKALVTFSRQLAVLLESGTDIVKSLELLQSQITNRTLKKIIGEVACDIRGGRSLSAALSKHPQAFSNIYCQSVRAGEQSGNMEVVLRQLADHMERGATTKKKVKSALMYPIVVSIVAAVVVTIMVIFVFPAFIPLYTAFGAELPFLTRMLMGIVDLLTQYGLYFMIVIVAGLVVGFAYTRRPAGKYWWDKLSLTLPVAGRINLLDELSRCCRTIALLFQVGLPLPEIMPIAINSTSNRAMAEALTEVQRALIKGEGLSGPMARKGLFLPLMVQMVGVGEETGELDSTLNTVAQTFEVEADEMIKSAIGFIQPAMTIIIALGIGFIVMALVSAMYTVYGNISF